MDRPHKLVLLGGSGVGKSNLALRFVKDQFTEHLESTIGAAFITQNVEQSDGTIVKFEIWDTAGQERYRSLAPMYYRGANSAIVVFDITSVASFEKAKDYITEVKQHGSQGVTVVLTANKCDLAEQRKVAEKDAKQYADDHRLLYMETSAKTGQNVKELFQLLANNVDASATETNPRFDLENHAPPQEGTCPC